MNGKIQGPQYDDEFKLLYKQYDMCSKSIPNFVGIDRFASENELGHCMSAIMRIKAGRSNYTGEDTPGGLARRVFEITTKCITATDVLELGMNSVDDVAPRIRDVHQALNNYPNLPSSYTGLAEISKWIKFFEPKSATYCMSPEEVRGLKYDLGQALQ